MPRVKHATRTATPEADNEALRSRIVTEIQESEAYWISFARFMALALYEPNLGYYNSSLPKLGEHGDFVTAPEVSPLFARVLGRQCQQVLSDLPGADILEIGAGTGKMAKDLLLFLEEEKTLPRRYLILEISTHLRACQQTFLREQIPHLYGMIEWIERWPVVPLTGIVIANEVVDVLPFHRFLWTQDSVQEMGVGWQEGSFVWRTRWPESQVLSERLQQLKCCYFMDVDDYLSEVCLELTHWMERLSQSMQQGLILIVDYGYPAREYYHPERCQGTLMCYQRHRGYTNPLQSIGLQDITASVDFSWLAECAVRHGLTVAGFTTQAAFLINNGLLQCARSCYNTTSSTEINRHLHRLLSPNTMGELVKVMGLTCRYEVEVQGFVQYDRRARL